MKSKINAAKFTITRPPFEEFDTIVVMLPNEERVIPFVSEGFSVHIYFFSC
jgi:hypothetical protein